MKSFIVTMCLFIAVFQTSVTIAQTTTAADSVAVRPDSAVVAPKDTASAAILTPPSPGEIRPTTMVWPQQQTVMVMVQMTIGSNGYVQDVRIIKSVPLLDAAVVEAAWQWRFPPQPEGALPIRLIIPFVFTVTPLSTKH